MMGMVRIQRRLIERRHGNKGYQYPIMIMTIPARFHHIFEPLLEFDFEVEVRDLGTYIHLILTGRQYQNLSLLDVNVELAKERKLEILLKAIESLKLTKKRSNYWGIPLPLSALMRNPIKRPDYDNVHGQ